MKKVITEFFQKYPGIRWVGTALAMSYVCGAPFAFFAKHTHGLIRIFFELIGLLIFIGNVYGCLQARKIELTNDTPSSYMKIVFQIYDVIARLVSNPVQTFKEAVADIQNSTGNQKILKIVFFIACVLFLYYAAVLMISVFIAVSVVLLILSLGGSRKNVCPNCGARVNAHDTYCPKCGGIL